MQERATSSNCKDYGDEKKYFYFITIHNGKDIFIHVAGYNVRVLKAFSSQRGESVLTFGGGPIKLEMPYVREWK